MKTKIKIRVQAEGGKFLADDIGGATIVIRNKITGKFLAQGVTRGNSSGFLKKAYSDTASQRVIVTSEPSGTSDTVHWLDAASTDPTQTVSLYTAELDLDEPALVEFMVYGPTGGGQTAHSVTTTQWIVPGKDIVHDPGFVIEIPGLLLQVMKPATHTVVNKSNPILAFEANVAMMCGCPITYKNPGVWLPRDFEVSARIKLIQNHELILKDTVTLEFDDHDGTPGIFSASYNAASLMEGNYQAEFSAYQCSTGNTGAGIVSFIVPEI